MAKLDPTSRWAYLWGGLIGFLSGAAGVAVSEAVTALMTGVTSPLISVGNRAVDWVPRPLKEFAIETFGSHDKQVLIGSVIAGVALVAIIAGVLGARRPKVGLSIFAVLVLIALATSVTDRAATAGTWLRLVPVIALAVVAIGSLALLLRFFGVPVTHPADRSTSSPDRRAFLITAGATAAVAVVGGVIAKAYGSLAASASRAGINLPKPSKPAPPVPPGATLGIDGITPYLTSNADFYRVDTALRVPDVPTDGWRLRIHGMVDKELELTYADLMRRNLVEKRITLTCVSNQVGGDLLGNATWLGVPMHELLAEAGVQDGADAVKSTSADDFTSGTPLSVLTDPERGALVAIGMNGEPLPLQHGFPARMVTPGLYGYVSATKWLVDLEVTRFADFKAYWTTRGYSAEAPIKTSSRIDVPKPLSQLKTGRTPIAGVAWSQARGIERVEVRIDGGAWQEAELAKKDSIDTWRQWVYYWDATPGSHRFEVRATDATGYTQTAERAPIAPDGSTGLDSINVTVS